VIGFCWFELAFAEWCSRPQLSRPRPGPSRSWDQGL